MNFWVASPSVSAPGSADDMSSPVTKEESTRVYADQ